MSFLQKVCEFLVTHDVVFLSVALGGVWCFGAANWLRNVYRKQNTKFGECCRNVAVNPQFKSMYLAKLPVEYLRQWRAYVNSGASRPSLTFEFVPHRKKLVLWPLFGLCAAVSTAYAALFFANMAFREYAVFQLAFWLSFAMVLLVNDNLFKKKERRARQNFGKFVAVLNAVELKCDNVKTGVCSEDGGKKIGAQPDALEQVSELLRQHGETTNRTTQQQQKINRALNGLLQAYAKNASAKNK